MLYVLYRGLLYLVNGPLHKELMVYAYTEGDKDKEKNQLSELGSVKDIKACDKLD